MIDLEKIADFARKFHENNDDGHGFDHIERVVALAQRLLNTEPSASSEIVLTAAYLHDTYDEKLVKNSTDEKAKVAEFLHSIFDDKAIIEQIFHIIDNMSFSSNLLERKKLDINGQIVQDADRLDAMGAWGIVRTLNYGWSKNRTLYEPKIAPRSYQSKEDYHSQKDNSTINHFYEKLFLLKASLNTDEAKKMGASRDKIMHDFVTAIEQEFDETH